MRRLYPEYKDPLLFKLGDKVEYFNIKKEYQYATIVDKIEPHKKPNLFLIQKWKLFKLPINTSSYTRWVAKFDESEHCIVFPDNPKRITYNRLYLTGDVTITKLHPEITKVKPLHPHPLHV